MDDFRQPHPAHEIAAVRTDAILLNRPSNYPNPCTGQLWHFGPLYSPQVRQVMEAVKDTVRRGTVINEWHLELLVRTGTLASNSQVDSAVVLFYRGPIEADDKDVVERMRSRAAQHLAALQAPPRFRHGAEHKPFLLSNESPTDLGDLTRFSGAALLGQKIEYSMTASVPGRPPLKLEGAFRRAPHRPTDTELLEVIGRITSTKSNGRFQSVGIQGQTANALPAPFRVARVDVHGSLREQIRDAVESPSLRLRMTIRKTVTATHKARPLTTYTLESARIDSAASSTL